MGQDTTLVISLGQRLKYQFAILIVLYHFFPFTDPRNGFFCLFVCLFFYHSQYASVLPVEIDLWPQQPQENSLNALLTFFLDSHSVTQKDMGIMLYDHLNIYVYMFPNFDSHPL